MIGADSRRVVVDARPLQEPQRAPITALYLERLLSAFAQEPQPNESFLVVLRALRGDPTRELEAAGLTVTGRRWVLPTGRIRSAGLTLDTFLLRAAEIRAASGVGRGGAVYHSAGGALPLASGLPIVATLLDVAPWELPERYAATTAARFGHRLRLRLLHDATRLIVPSQATAETARRRLRLAPERIAVVRLAPGPAFDRDAGARAAQLRARLRLPRRYFAFAGRYDARKDLATLCEPLAGLRDERTMTAVADPWPPRLVMASLGGGTRAEVASDARALTRTIERRGLGEVIVLTPPLSAPDVAGVVAGAAAFVYPALSEAGALAAIEALAVGTPVIASKVGGLPEVVGSAGIIVEPRRPERLAAALRALWIDEALRGRLASLAADRASRTVRTWRDVARETRSVYADASGDADARRVTISGRVIG